MGKKRKATGQDKQEADQTASNTSIPSRVKSGGFCLRSSLNVPFLVVSDRQLVDGVPTPSSAEWKELLALCTEIVKSWDVRGAVLLSDFEGELTGLEGELISAAFQRTLVVDSKSLRPLHSTGVNRDMGLLFDLRCSESIALVKRIMESDMICKMIWGAAGDVTGLRFTPVKQPLAIQSACVVDVQLAFSSVGRRLSMAKMLERLPSKAISGLPDKSCMDFASAHAFNRRAFSLPLQTTAAAYAVDDLHRLDAVLQHQKPGHGTYLEAQRQTSALHSALLQRPVAGAAERLSAFHAALANKDGLERQVAAVRIKRHLLALKRLGEPCTEFSVMEKEANAILVPAGVHVANSLCFSGDVIPDDEENGSSSNKKAEDGVINKKRKSDATSESAGETLEADSGISSAKRKRKNTGLFTAEVLVCFDLWRRAQSYRRRRRVS
eukprot:TRINITY_DN112432_c0_g1_i1.p1 TRINITY_DN112432_c0_g1~~TRINITY_DN112432_c0_g1_i1.p1  ORF type:complete len:450 (+),score=76.62 TRINITY_DN112432_c0_g1_i1:38-1351(+)